MRKSKRDAARRIEGYGTEKSQTKSPKKSSKERQTKRANSQDTQLTEHQNKRRRRKEVKQERLPDNGDDESKGRPRGINSEKVYGYFTMHHGLGRPRLI